ncbi:hypothetical protein JHK85_001164 [Glycine max]|nr:hypothetical protein JHK85_001164 [Glycine max]
MARLQIEQISGTIISLKLQFQISGHRECEDPITRKVTWQDAVGVNFSTSFSGLVSAKSEVKRNEKDESEREKKQIGSDRIGSDQIYLENAMQRASSVPREKNVTSLQNKKGNKQNKTRLDLQAAIKRLPRLSSLFQGMVTILYLNLKYRLSFKSK